MTRPKIPDGFTVWTGGKNPVPGKRVTILFQDSEVVTGDSEMFYWDWKAAGSGGDILAYRIEEARHGG